MHKINKLFKKCIASSMYGECIQCLNSTVHSQTVSTQCKDRIQLCNLGVDIASVEDNKMCGKDATEMHPQSVTCLPDHQCGLHSLESQCLSVLFICTSEILTKDLKPTMENTVQGEAKSQKYIFHYLCLNYIKKYSQC